MVAFFEGKIVIPEVDRMLTVNEIFKAKENQHFKKIEALNTAAKNLIIGDFDAFEEFTAFDDSDYDSSDYEELPSDGPPIDGAAPRAPTLNPNFKPPPKSDKNHDVKPKESFLRSSLDGTSIMEGSRDRPRAVQGTVDEKLVP